LHPPTGSSLHDLRPLVPKLSVYLLSFVFVAIYWNNHHNLMHIVDRVTEAALWANAHLLFWLSLTPAAAAWLGPHHGDSAPVAIYGAVLLGSAIAYGILVRCLVVANEPDSRIARAFGEDRKGNLSVIAYIAAIAVAPAVPWLRSASTSPSRSPGSSPTEGWSASRRRAHATPSDRRTATDSTL
jgi:uncharacterized membrane protein